MKPEGGGRPPSVHDSQREAIARAREVARNQGAELFIYGRNGHIRERDSDGSDPFPPKG